ncbi:MAG: hypothetical protein M0Q42_12850 [Xanthomonadales bacterium]|nr:hypothetical protein [Xanthomonadales bacterium]
MIKSIAATLLLVLGVLAILTVMDVLTPAQLGSLGIRLVLIAAIVAGTSALIGWLLRRR